METIDIIRKSIPLLKRRTLVMAESSDPNGGLCTYAAFAVSQFLMQEGIPHDVAAGSFYARAVPPELDDGVMPTTFAFEYQERRNPLIAMLMMGNIPEMHVWVDVAGVGVLDITTGDLPRLAKKIAGMEWLEKPPLDYVLGAVPEGMRYVRSGPASLFAEHLMTYAILTEMHQKCLDSEAACN